MARQTLEARQYTAQDYEDWIERSGLTNTKRNVEDVTLSGNKEYLSRPNNLARVVVASWEMSYAGNPIGREVTSIVFEFCDGSQGLIQYLNTKNTFVIHDRSALRKKLMNMNPMMKDEILGSVESDGKYEILKRAFEELGVPVSEMSD